MTEKTETIEVSLRVEFEGKGDYQYALNAALEPGDRMVQAATMVTQLATGFIAVARPAIARTLDDVKIAGRVLLPENREYPGQPGAKGATEITADGVKIPIPVHATHLVIGTDESIRLVDGGDTLWSSHPADVLGASMSAGAAVSRLRELVATDGRGPMFSGEEILAILNGDAADDEPMTADEIDRRGMYAPPYDTIESRHVFSTMLANSRCTKCKMKRSDVYVAAGGRICKG